MAPLKHRVEENRLSTLHQIAHVRERIDAIDFGDSYANDLKNLDLTPPASREKRKKMFAKLNTERAKAENGLQTSEDYEYALIKTLDKFDLRSVLDIGVGRFTLDRVYNMDRATYLGVDISPERVKKANAQWFSKPWDTSRRAMVLDVLTEPLPGSFDLVVVRKFINRISHDDALRLLWSINRSKSRFVALTFHQCKKKKECTINNNDVKTVIKEGKQEQYAIDLSKPPFNLGPPLYEDTDMNYLENMKQKWPKEEHEFYKNNIVSHIGIWKLPLRTDTLDKLTEKLQDKKGGEST